MCKQNMMRKMNYTTLFQNIGIFQQFLSLPNTFKIIGIFQQFQSLQWKVQNICKMVLIHLCYKPQESLGVVGIFNDLKQCCLIHFSSFNLFEKTGQSK